MTGPFNTIDPADALAYRLKDFFCARNFAPVDPPLLLPVDLVLDPMGEDIRRRLLIVTAPDGEQLCLRPDFTLPVARHHLALVANGVANGVADGAASAGRYAYAGGAYRFPSSGETTRRSAALRQAGVEVFGDTDADQTDAQVLALAVEAVRMAGLSTPELTLGDIALFGAFVDALGLEQAVGRHLKRLFAQTEPLLNRLRKEPESTPAQPGGYTALGAALSALSPDAGRDLVEEIMAIAGVGQKPRAGLAGGRSPQEIAERFVEQATLARGGVLTPAIIATIEAYLAINDTPRRAAARLGDLAQENRLEFGPALEAFKHRLDLIEAAGVDLSQARFAADFGRTIAYYTGMVFEIRDALQPTLGQIAGGGRYDDFLEQLGAGPGMPAVGCSVYVDRLAAATGAGGAGKQ